MHVLVRRFSKLFSISQTLTVCHYSRSPARPETDVTTYKAEFLRAYIAKARTFKPFVPNELMQEIILSYTELRKRHNDERHLFCTPRTLLSILRLSQSAARLRFASEVNKDDVAEAIRLFNVAKSTTEEDESTGGARRGVGGASADYQTAIFEIIKEMGKREERKIKKSEILTRIAARGYSEAQFGSVVTVYESINVIAQDSKHIWLVNPA